MDTVSAISGEVRKRHSRPKECSIIDHAFASARIDFGLIIMWWVVYLVITCLAVERLKAAGSVKSFLVFARRKVTAKGNDTESGKAAALGSETAPVHSDDDIKIDKSETLFAWKDLCYTVPVRGGHRQLLNKVQGFTKPGVSPAIDHRGDTLVGPNVAILRRCWL
jgi:hypothetical protein